MKSTAIAALFLSLGMSLPALVQNQPPTVVPSVPSSPPQRYPLAQLGQISVGARYAVPFKFAEAAPSLKQLQTLAIDKLSGVDLYGTLPARVEVISNTFKSTVTGDVIYSIDVAVFRPVCILGTVETTDAVVWSTSAIGRTPAEDANDDITNATEDLLRTLRQQIERANPTPKPASEVH